MDEEVAKRAVEFVRRLLNPEDLGYVANRELRDCAREVLGLPRVETEKPWKPALNKGE